MTEITIPPGATSITVSMGSGGGAGSPNTVVGGCFSCYHRRTIEYTPTGLRICAGDHPKSDSCDWVYYTKDKNELH